MLKFPTPYRYNLQDIFLKGIKHWLLVFFLTIIIFFKNIYFQNDETGILEVLEIKIFFAVWWEGLHIFFLNFSLLILKFSGRTCGSFLRKKREKNRWISVSNHYLVFSKSLRGNRKLWNEQYIIKVFAN